MRICKNCQTENQDDFQICQNCGAELPAEEVIVEETPCCEVPEKKKSNWLGLAAVIAGIVAIAVVGVLIIFGGSKEAPAQVTAHHINAFGNPSYSIHFTEAEDGTVTYDYMNEAEELISVSQEEVDALLDAQIATCGDYVLTNRDLPYYYSESYYMFSQQYGYFISLLINGAQGLDEQLSTDGVNTWQHMFVQDGVDIFRNMAGIAMDAKAKGYDMTEVNDAVEAYKVQMEASAQQTGYESVDDFVCDILGPGNTFEACLDYYELAVLYQEYTKMLAEGIAVTEEEVDAYYAENEATLTEQGVTKVDKPVVNVRHILIAPEQTTNEDGTTSISDEAWAAAEAEANKVYDTWKNGEATEESFAELAAEFTTDPGSKETGGLYEDVYPGQMVTEFNDWCFADGRKVGDHDMVKTSYGYHIMFFSGEGDHIHWRKTVKDTIANERLMAEIENILFNYPLESDLSKVVLLETIAPTVPSEENPGGVVIEEVDPSEVPAEHTHTEECEHEPEAEPEE